MTKPSHPRTRRIRDTGPDEIPLIVRQIVDRLHVAASRREVIRAMRQTMAPYAKTREWRSWRRNAYRLALEQHRFNRGLCAQVQRGRFDDSMRCWPDLEEEAANITAEERRAAEQIRKGQTPLKGRAV